MRPHPHLFEIATVPWLERLSSAEGRAVTLGSVPDSEWDRLRGLGFDMVYLMGIWRRSAIGRHIARSEHGLFAAYDAALPDWSLADVVGSPFSVADYSPDPRVGTWDGLARVRRTLHKRGIQLVLDFVPNHTAFDHPWVASHPRRYITASLEQFRARPGAFRIVEANGAPRALACGRDPHFPAWTDVAQLNYFEADTRAAMIAQLRALAEHCDGARCDMAMLVLNDVFARTWQDFGGPGAQTEFWEEAAAAVPELVLIAEAYWDLESRLQDLGFAFTYDKRFYDRLAHHSADALRDHLGAAMDYQRRCVRFLENHDEPRSCVVFGPERLQAAAVLCAASPGMRFYFDGQLEGRCRRTPVQLARWLEEPSRDDLVAFYRDLLDATGQEIFHDGEWRLLEVTESFDASHAQIVAFAWTLGGETCIVAANTGAETAHGRVALERSAEEATPPRVVERLAAREGSRELPLWKDGALHLRLPGGDARIWSVEGGSTTRVS